MQIYNTSYPIFQYFWILWNANILCEVSSRAHDWLNTEKPNFIDFQFPQTNLILDLTISKYNFN